ncbi:MAG: hypothetical protein RRA92_02595 [Gemmatimonadota bacterium]|nr:hypothetical protein [Gemmatimonadota bacterium]
MIASRWNALRTALLVLAVLVVPACDDDDPTEPVSLTTADLVGSYAATVFTVTEDGSVADVLTVGGSLEIDLAADNTTSGSLVIPASLSESGTEEILSLAGTWSLSGSTVTFVQGADTFIRDSDWAASPGRLEAEEDFGGILIRVVLERI